MHALARSVHKERRQSARLAHQLTLLHNHTCQTVETRLTQHYSAQARVLSGQKARAKVTLQRDQKHSQQVFLQLCPGADHPYLAARVAPRQQQVSSRASWMAVTREHCRQACSKARCSQYLVQKARHNHSLKISQHHR